MRVTAKKLVTLGLTALMVVGTFTTAFAAEWTYELHSTSEVSSGADDPTETVKMFGKTETVWNFNANDKLVLTKAANMPANMKISVDFYAHKGADGSYKYYNADPIIIGDAQEGKEHDLYKAVEGFGESETFKRHSGLYNFGSFNMEETIWGIKISNYDSSLNYATEQSNGIIWIKLVGTRNQDTQTSQPTQTTSSWASDSKGWWIQNSDGSYLTNAWYQSPTSGLWYYMGADGYMLTNTTTPDGHTVNADGVWVQ